MARSPPLAQTSHQAGFTHRLCHTVKSPFCRKARFHACFTPAFSFLLLALFTPRPFSIFASLIVYPIINAYMTISYNWLLDYLPIQPDPERLSRILTSIGLEVESMELFETVPGSLAGLLIGEVRTVEQHPNADKLRLTTVNIGQPELLKIVCGAPNVAVGQKVVVATVGTTIHPLKGEPITMKLAKIRGEESQGMICAEDEIGLGESHAGIMVLPADLKPGTPAAQHFKPYRDHIYEIGLTPNRMDAMSHLGVARDVCAYLTHHDKKDARVKTPSVNGFKVQDHSLPISIKIENKTACRRFSGVTLNNITVGPSPQWLKDRLLSIGLRPINNIVDITNFVLHETGQPLHAYDYDAITGQEVIAKNLPAGSKFTTLDDKERTLAADDLMICNANEGMCIAGVFGGAHSGVTAKTNRIFLESAWFAPTVIRRTSFRQGLRTDAASRFEKGTDISQTVQVLKRAALLMAELAGGTISSDIVDIYPDAENKKEVALKYHYLKKLSGKNYHPDTVKKILESLGFEVIKDGIDELRLAVPFSKPDISLPADIVEEILRIDGLDNVDIPTNINISPAVEKDPDGRLRDKFANYLAGAGFREILTNSISNAAWYTEEQLSTAVKMLNNLSVELNVLRPAMLETGLAVIAHNLNRRNKNLQFFEWGKTYHSQAVGKYLEEPKFCLYLTGEYRLADWRSKAIAADFFVLKGTLEKLAAAAGLGRLSFTAGEAAGISQAVQINAGKELIGFAGLVSAQRAATFDIKQPVWYAELDWRLVLEIADRNKISFRELPKQQPVQRDLALLVNKELAYGSIEATVKKIAIQRLKKLSLFDLFESDKLGAGKKSVAVSFTFLDEEKTMTDKDIDGMMQKIMHSLENELGAEIRK